MIRKVQTGSERNAVGGVFIEVKDSQCRLHFCPQAMLVSGGNERADRLADSVTIDNDQPMDGADVVNALRELGGAEDLTSLSQMYELRLKKLY